MKAGFNLISEPWIPLRPPAGEVKEVGLLEFFATAHEWTGIETGSPLQDAALLRLAMAIALRVLGPEDTEDLAAIISHGAFPAEPFQDYFSKWSDRFDLFDDAHPFYQCTDEETRSAKNATTAKLSHALASGSNATLFDHTLDEASVPLTPAAAARLLVATQNFALGGGVSKPFNFSHAPLADGYMTVLQGPELFTTISLNLAGFLEQPAGLETWRDSPCWERDVPVNPERRYPWGWLDHLTWQSRRILLERSDDRVGTVRMLQGDAPIKDPVPFEPAFAYRCRDEKQGYLPLKIRQDRALWRDLDSLVTSYRVPSSHGKNDTTRSSAPKVVQEVLKLRQDLPALGKRRIALDVYGMCTDQAKIYLWQHQRFPLADDYLSTPALCHHIRRSLTLAEETGQALGSATWFLARYLLETETPDSEPDNKQIKARAHILSREDLFWSSLEEPFLAHYRRIPEDPEQVIEQWSLLLRRQAVQAFNETGKKLSGKSRELKSLARAETVLRGRLNKIFAD